MLTEGIFPTPMTKVVGYQCLVIIISGITHMLQSDWLSHLYAIQVVQWPEVIHIMARFLDCPLFQSSNIIKFPRTPLKKKKSDRHPTLKPQHFS